MTERDKVNVNSQEESEPNVVYIPVEDFEKKDSEKVNERRIHIYSSVISVFAFIDFLVYFCQSLFSYPESVSYAYAMFSIFSLYGYIGAVNRNICQLLIYLILSWLCISMRLMNIYSIYAALTFDKNGSSHIEHIPRDTLIVYGFVDFGFVILRSVLFVLNYKLMYLISERPRLI